MKRNGEPERIDGILKRLEKRNPIIRGGIKLRIERAAKEIILGKYGKEMAEECFLHSYGSGVVTIGLKSSVMRHEMQCFFAGELRRELEKKLKNVIIRKVRFIIACKD